MKEKQVSLIVEVFDNGITTKWRDLSGDVEPSSSVAVEGGESQAIGDEIWSDIKAFMSNNDAKKVKAVITYTKED